MRDCLYYPEGRLSLTWRPQGGGRRALGTLLRAVCKNLERFDELVVEAGMKQYDVAVIGGGPAGYLAAERASEAGLSTLLVEKGRLAAFA